MRFVSNIFLFALIILFYSCKDDLPEKINLPERNIKSFTFVGMINKNPGIYKYNFSLKDYEVFWSSRREKVVELFHSEYLNNTYFLTAKSYGRKGAFPFINNARLYLIENDSSVSLIREIGSGLQIFGGWDDHNSFRITFNYIDSTISNYVNNQIFIFNPNGKLLTEEFRTFNIIDDGYPVAQKKINMISPYNSFSVDTADNASIKIFLKNLRNNSRNLIKNSYQKLNQVKWHSNDSLLILSTIFLTPDNETIYTVNPQTSSLIIYSLHNKKTEAQWNGSGIKSFFITGNLLIFDDGFDENSVINIYDFHKNRIIKTIRVKGGCGLKSIPSLPEFSA